MLVCFGALLVVTGGVAATIGLDFFPSADVGLIKLHFRAPAGTRIEETEQLVLQVEDAIRRIIPADELDTINDTIGVPSSFNLAFVPSDNVGEMDAEILISLKRGHHPTIGYIRAIRADAAGAVPRQPVLLPDRRYRQPGAEFRPAGADRRADPGREFRPLLRAWRSNCCSG